MHTKSIEMLKIYFGYDSFRKGQEEIISRILQDKDTVGIMPTGGGKSICYQIPAMILPGITIVISPLISLMKDQVDALIKVGIPATFINSSLTNKENQERINGIIAGEYKIIYIAPERLESTFFLNLLTHVEISLIAIDEAHCISQWGHDFRPSYLSVRTVIGKIYPKPTILALTATATPQVAKDICELLKIDVNESIITGFSRENLFYQVMKGQNRDSFLEDYLKKNSTSAGIIYAATRKEVERIYNQLRKKGISAGKYHAGMPDKERSQFQEQFLYDDISVIVATSAFGMGINKSNVRFVIHYNIPRNVESYYQEAGRAGRDGEKSECILLFSPQDIHIQKFLIDQSEMDHVRKELEFYKLQQMVGYCHTEACLQQYVLAYFGEENSKACNHCGNCVDDRENTDITKEAQMIFSCIKRMNERFGKTFVGKVLTGSGDAKIKNLGFQKLSTYGIMKERTQKNVCDLIDFLTAEQYLTPTNGAYPVLTLTNRAINVLRGEELILKKENVQVKQIMVDNLLFERLRQLRKNIAQTEGIPPYIIFSDQSLREMSVKVPTTTNSFLSIKGVGERKLEQYGEVFMTVINAYLETNDTKPIIEIDGNQPKHVKQAKTEKSHHETYQFYKNGLSIAQISEQRGLASITIEGHLLKCSEEGFAIEWDQIINKDVEHLIENAIKEVGAEKLKPIKDMLPEEVSYFMIKSFMQKKLNLSRINGQ